MSEIFKRYVSLELDKEIINQGDLLTGKVEINSSENLQLTRFQVILKRLESWSKTDSSNPNKLEVLVKELDPIFLIDKIHELYGQKATQLPPGKHTFPFQIQLSRTLPPTIEDQSTYSRYQLILKGLIKSSFYEISKNFILYAVPDPQWLNVNKFNVKQESSSSLVNFNVEFKKHYFKMREDCIFIANIDNRLGSCAVKTLKCSFYNIMKLNGNDDSEIKLKLRDYKYTCDIPKGSSQKLCYSFNLNNEEKKVKNLNLKNIYGMKAFYYDSWDNPTSYSSLVVNRYVLKMTLYFNKFVRKCHRPRIKIPINICYYSEDDKAIQAKYLNNNNNNNNINNNNNESQSKKNLMFGGLSNKKTFNEKNDGDIASKNLSQSVILNNNNSNDKKKKMEDVFNKLEKNKKPPDDNKNKAGQKEINKKTNMRFMSDWNINQEYPKNNDNTNVNDINSLPAVKNIYSDLGIKKKEENNINLFASVPLRSNFNDINNDGIINPNEINGPALNNYQDSIKKEDKNKILISSSNINDINNINNINNINDINNVNNINDINNVNQKSNINDINNINNINDINEIQIKNINKVNPKANENINDINNINNINIKSQKVEQNINDINNINNINQDNRNINTMHRESQDINAISNINNINNIDDIKQKDNPNINNINNINDINNINNMNDINVKTNQNIKNVNDKNTNKNKENKNQNINDINDINIINQNKLNNDINNINNINSINNINNINQTENINNKNENISKNNINEIKNLPEIKNPNILNTHENDFDEDSSDDDNNNPSLFASVPLMFNNNYNKNININTNISEQPKKTNDDSKIILKRQSNLANFIEIKPPKPPKHEPEKPIEYIKINNDLNIPNMYESIDLTKINSNLNANNCNDDIKNDDKDGDFFLLGDDAQMDNVNDFNNNLVVVNNDNNAISNNMVVVNNGNIGINNNMMILGDINDVISKNMIIVGDASNYVKDEDEENDLPDLDEINRNNNNK